VFGAAVPRKDVLEHAEQPYLGQLLAELLTELPVDRVQGVLAELDVTAERPLERRLRGIGVLRHQQCPVPGPPDDGHRLDDLPFGVHRTVVPRQADESAARDPLHRERQGETR